jgi:two-component system NtrC family sensor kinase
LSQQLSLEIALPLLSVLIVLAGLAFLLLRTSLRTVTSSLQQLVGETRRIAAGDLSAPLPVRGADEVGRLRAAFESMRQNLQARVEENQRLLTVSQGVGTNLDAGAHIDPILEAALASGASSARLVFNGDGNPVGFGKGAGQRIHQSLDEQVLSLTREQNRVLLTNPARARLKAAKGTELPQTVAAFALENNGEHLGALWLAYESPQTFSPEAVRYLETLADQAAKAAVNARLYTSASLGRQRMEAVLHANPDALLLLDERQRIVFANAAAQKLFKLSSESLNGRAIVDLVGTQAFMLLFNSGEANPHGNEVKLLGSAYHGVVSLIRDGQDLLGIVLTLRDTSVARQIDSARADFLTTLSHDLHDPLDLTRGYLNMLGMVGDLSPQQQSYVQKMEHNLENISRLAMDLLDIERVSGLKSLQLQSFSLPELIREVVDDLSPRSRQKKIEVTVQNGQGSPIQADRTLVQRALYNLLDNAIKFSPRDGLVEVRTRFDTEKVKIAVTDQGGGVAPLDLPHIFEAGKSKRGSTGLAIVKSIAERHSGRVWAQSELGTGSTFYLEVPLQPAKKA